MMLEEKPSKDLKIVCCVQVRMGSTRLPGKAMLSILGQPVIWHVINRLRYSKLIDEIVISTSKNPLDDVIENFARSNGIHCYRGKENDLMDRLYQTARLFNADAIVRITADCPLIDPRVVDMVIQKFLENVGKIDYVSNTIKRTFPDGLDTEVISYEALQKAWQEVTDEFWREWVTMYFVENPQKFRLMNVEYFQDLSKLRWTLDYIEDLEFIREVYRHLYSDSKKIFYMEEILKLLEQHPEIAEINSKYAGLDMYRSFKQKRGSR